MSQHPGDAATERYVRPISTAEQVARLLECTEGRPSTAFNLEVHSKALMLLAEQTDRQLDVLHKAVSQNKSLERSLEGMNKEVATLSLAIEDMNTALGRLNNIINPAGNRASKIVLVLALMWGCYMLGLNPAKVLSWVRLLFGGAT